MNDTVLHYWWMPASRGAVALAFGVLALLMPGIALLSLVFLFAAYALFGGIVWIVGAIKNREADDHWRVLLIAGLVGVGAALIAQPREVQTPS